MGKRVISVLMHIKSSRGLELIRDDVFVRSVLRCDKVLHKASSATVELVTFQWKFNLDYFLILRVLPSQLLHEGLDVFLGV